MSGATEINKSKQLIEGMKSSLLAVEYYKN